MSQLSLDLTTPLSEVEQKRIEVLGEEWFTVLREVLQNGPRLRNAASVVGQRRQVTEVYPAKEDVFRAFKLTPYKKVKVVIVGQDPYHNGLADGLAFSTRSLDERPVSLQTIFSGIAESVKVFPTVCNLEKWAEQGVLLINKVLTVEKGLPNSHKGLGWEQLTTTAIRALSNKKTPVCYLLWGSDAKELKQYIVNPEHLVIEAEHPAAPAHQGRKEWHHNNCFNLCNEYLVKHGETPIDWAKVNDDLPF